MRVEWQEYLSIGVLEIDTQHKLLFEKFNAFLAACEGKIDPDKVNTSSGSSRGLRLPISPTRSGSCSASISRVSQRIASSNRAFAAEVAKLKERLRIEGATPGLITAAAQFITGGLSQHITTMDRVIGDYAMTHPDLGF